MRRTLWVTTPELAPVLHAASTLALVGPDRRRTVQWMLASGLVADADAADRWIDAGIEELVAEIDRRGETTARELGEALPHLTAAIGVVTDKSYGGLMPAHTRLLTIMGFMGLIVRGRPLGTWINGQYRWATTARWLGSAWPELELAGSQSALGGRLPPIVRARHHHRRAVVDRLDQGRDHQGTRGGSGRTGGAHRRRRGLGGRG